MAVTTLSDLKFNTQAFADAMAGSFNSQLNALTSGIVSPIPAGLIPSGTPGQYMNAPQWETLDYTGTSQIAAASAAPTPGKNGQWKTYAPYLAREQAWGGDFLSIVQAAEDAEAEVARQIGRWAADFVTYLSAQSLIGAMTTALNATHTTQSTYEGATITFEGALAAKALLTDNQGKLTGCLMHGKVHSDAVRDQVVNTLAGSQGATDGYRTGLIQEIAGSFAYMNDIFCAAVSTIYPTYFGAPGSIIFHSTDIPNSAAMSSGTDIDVVSANGITVQIERHRSQAGGGSNLITARLNIATAVKGLEWQSTANPAPTDLATGANWAVSTNADAKDIKIVRLTTL